MASSTPTTSASVQDNVSVRVIALAHATNENEDVHLVVSLDSDVSQLKSLLQTQLSNHPRPESQRLIYLGRPLTDGTATLRQILRLEPTNADHPPAHVLHLVVRDSQPAISSNPTRPQPAQSQNPQPTTIPPPPGLIHAQPTFNLPQNAFPPGHPAHAMFQNAMQQHMAIHNQNRAQQLHNNQPSHVPMPPMNFTQPARNIDLSQDRRADTNQVTPVPNIESEAHTNNTNPATTNNQPTVFQSSITMRVHETVGPNGERVRTVTQDRPLLPQHINPVERSASAPGSGADPAGLTPVMPNRFNPLLPFAQPAFPPMLHPQMANLQFPSTGIPAVPMTTYPTVLQQQSRNPMLYLLSSPSGPEALLFTPNHGYFSSQQPGSSSPMPPQAQTQNIEQPTRTHQPTPTQPVQDGQEPVGNNIPGQVALRPQPQGLGQGQAQPARREGEDLIALAMQRGWLFLRLYMFIFVLSDAGTWRRYILLIVASLVCLLPRNNRFTEILEAARRHFDNLIGPAQPPTQPRRPPARDQPGANVGTEAAANGSTNPSNSTPHSRDNQQMPTPEEHARRLLREHEQRNPNVIRDTIYRIEQGVALFLASLIPGVGERHVRAREEARRLVQEEEERRRREDETNQQQPVESGADKTTPESSSIPPVSIETGSSSVATGVETTSVGSTSASAGDEGVRLRGGNSNT